MIDPSPVDYAALDVPEVLLRLFHPRPESSPTGASPLRRPDTPPYLRQKPDKPRKLEV